jgi:hypothetical protein
MAKRARFATDEPASEKQISYLRSLLAQKRIGSLADYEPEYRPLIAEIAASLDELPADLTKREASGMIEIVRTAINRQDIVMRLIAPAVERADNRQAALGFEQVASRLAAMMG